jgi:hypothetical protein
MWWRLANNQPWDERAAWLDLTDRSRKAAAWQLTRVGRLSKCVRRGHNARHKAESLTFARSDRKFISAKELEGVAGGGAGHAARTATTGAEFARCDRQHLDARILQPRIDLGVSFVGHDDTGRQCQRVVAVVPLPTLGPCR